ncbi:unnamed protein product [Arabidopsis thaliana]|uniref:(thale cress) hypothetical protein n=1 Tax=Arabidopsis thaliana TaxID=3702 RepID=A0A7G2E3Y4_ARATH|nr:unnamed protein product [Arabidopsis thaliana]
MDGGENSTAVNTGNQKGKTAGQDEVLLVIGEWVRVDNLAWQFEPKTVEGSSFIRLRTNMTYEELSQKVKDKLGLRGRGITVKMAYQFPEWMAIDEGNGSPPQYISEDSDVTMFIQMRRHIEEVNLCVTVVQHTIPSSPVAVTDKNFNSEDSDDSDYDSEEELHQFALDSAVLGPTLEPTAATTETEQHRRTRRELFPTGGISIREPEECIRLKSPDCLPTDKGKGIMDPIGKKGKAGPSRATVTDTSTDSDDDLLIVPFTLPPNPPAITIPENADIEGADSSRAAVGTPHGNHVSPIGNAVAETDLQRQNILFWGRAQEALNTILSDFSDDPILFGRDAPPVFNDGKGEGVDSAFFDVKYEGDKLFVGRVFKSKSDCKIKIAIHAINRKFHFRTARSTPKFMVLKCISKTCPWRVYASKVDTSDSFQVRQANQRHTCTIDQRRRYHRLATTQVIGELMQSRFLGIKRGPNAAVIRKFLLDDYHVSISYWKAWRAREVAMEKSLGSMAGSYALIPAYAGLLQQANPGSLCFTEYDDDPTGLSKVYTQANHAACTVHLWRNIRHLYKPKSLCRLMSEAAQAFHVTDFNRIFLKIQKLNPGCAAYLVDLGFSEWTRVHSKGRRFNIMDSNICESWNNVIREAREYPLICMLEYIRTTLMDWFATRRAQAEDCPTTLAPRVQERVEENYQSAMSMSVKPICNFEFQVQERTGECFIVKLDESTCSCLEFQGLGIPCAHAIAAAARIGVPTDSLAANGYFNELVKLSYEEKIYPIHSVGGEVAPEIAAGTTGELQPPFVRRPPGRPRKIRILSRGEFKASTYYGTGQGPRGGVHVVVVLDTIRPPAVMLYKPSTTAMGC